MEFSDTMIIKYFVCHSVDYRNHFGPGFKRIVEWRFWLWKVLWYFITHPFDVFLFVLHDKYLFLGL